MHGNGSPLAITRYRARLLWLRLSHTRASRLDLLNLALAVIGAWSVIVTGARLLPLDGPLPTAGFWGVAIGSLLALYWFRYTRRPQDIFRLASRSEDAAQELRSWMAAGMRSEHAFAALTSYYEPLVEDLRRVPGFQDLQWPDDSSGRKALVLTLSPQVPQNLGDLLVEARRDRPVDWAPRASGFAGERQMLMTALRRNAFLVNPFGDEQGQNLVLDHISGGTTIGMEVSTATYGQIVRTSDSLINEFALFGYMLDRSAIRRRPVPLRVRGDRVLTLLPWRRAVHSWDAGTDVIVAPRGRAAGLGVALVLHERRGDSVTALLARRSSNVGTYPDVLHVIPAGMVNVRSVEPLAGDIDVSRLPRLTALAEFLEECFNLAELSGHSLTNFAGRVERELRERDLADVDPVFTGVAIDLLNLRTEICATMDLSGRAELVDAFEVSWEFTHNEALRRVDLRNGAAAAGRHEFVQSGLGALHLASRFVARSAGASSDLP